MKTSPFLPLWKFLEPGLFLLVVLMLCRDAEAAPRGRIESGQITSSALATNVLGDSATRPFKIYLPPSYDTSALRYPVIYVLHGHTLNENSVISPNPFATSAMQPALDSMIGQRSIGEMIAVFVNGTNRLNGSFYLNSAVIGDYETYIARDLVRLIDSQYRTLAARENRGIVGFSMGGWGAMHLSLKFPEVFSVVVAESGFYNSRSSWADGLTRQLISVSPTNLVQFATVPFPANVMQSLFAGLLPNLQRPFLYADYPYDLINRQFVLDQTAHERCMSGDVENGDLARYLDQPVKLNAIKLVHGTADNVLPISETRQFTNVLAAAAIPFDYQEHSGSHVFRADLALPFVSAHLGGIHAYIFPPSVAITVVTNSIHLTFSTLSGVVYQIETNSSLGTEEETWSEGALVNGDGQSVEINLPAPSIKAFFRVRATNL